ncbi:outer membrane protein assembly factor BamC [Aestuariibacter sp. AA17]|uniref:Outer membrane protein assembly factor BamC n=1 Tax=Fluctibacter corallii TaxID=2984329 RepID=A0ABT3A5T6_9ALTE|nr:outer membrane protein assembly factor BamC [Aestuariibacter sp. AA17]MCV2884051.1 outer membrane protein assembly factor BamC [Aestuariibacter sp. AA17]
MTRISAIVAGIGLTCITACTSLHERQTANGDFEYLEKSRLSSFKVPEELDQPDYSGDYDLPSVGANAPSDLLGDNITVVSPALVLPLVSGSHIEEGKKEATVWFDQIDDSKPLDETIWNSLLSFLEEQGIGVSSFDKDNQTLITDWLIIEESESNGWFDWTSTERSIGKRFEFTLTLKPHGRTAALKVNMKDYMETVGEDVIAELDAESERRNEVNVLNRVISHYQHQIRVADMKRIREIRRGLPMELGFNQNGDSAYVVNGKYEVVWPRLLLVLRKLGFNVKDLDQSNGLLFVSYGNSESSWWSSLFSSDDEKFNLEKDEYRMQVSSLSEDRTAITLMDNESVPFDAAKITELYAAFAKTMADDDLDIR